jgi:hypothetical protein
MKELLNTPIKDSVTNIGLFLGDLVKSEKGICGYIDWDDYYNRYIIKTDSGGNVYARTYTKIDKITKNNIDNYRVECRSSPNKKRW